MSRTKSYEVHILHEGYSKMVKDGIEANCTCTLIKGPKNIIIDTMTPWDKDIILEGLKQHNVKCEDIDYVICTHGHSDHIGNNNLFLNAKHIVGFSVSYRNFFYDHSFLYDEKLIIDDQVSVIGTPGHTLSDVTVLVNTSDRGLVAVAGDLFEREEDLKDQRLWMEFAYSESPKVQENNRNKILAMADYIVPGHGPMFKVTSEMKANVKQQITGQHYI